MSVDPTKMDMAKAIIEKNIRPDGTVYQPISLIQRHLLLGFSEAKKIIEELKERGILND